MISFTARWSSCPIPCHAISPVRNSCSVANDTNTNSLKRPFRTISLHAISLHAISRSDSTLAHLRTSDADYCQGRGRGRDGETKTPVNCQKDHRPSTFDLRPPIIGCARVRNPAFARSSAFNFGQRFGSMQRCDSYFIAVH